MPKEWKKRYLVKLPKRRSQCVLKLQGNAVIPGKVINRFCWIDLKRQSIFTSVTTRLGSEMCRSYRHAAHHFGAVIGMEFATLHQLYKLWEGIRQRWQEMSLEAAEAIRSTPKRLLASFRTLMKDWQKSTHRRIANRYETKLFASPIAFPVPPRDILDNPHRKKGNGIR